MTTKDKKIIEDSEKNNIPIFVFTAKDKLTEEIIRTYLSLCIAINCNGDHITAIYDRIQEFKNWQAKNPDKVKTPD